MPESDQIIKQLEDRLDGLVRTQIDFQKEISLIRGELARLRTVGPNQKAEVPPESGTSAAGTRPPIREPHGQQTSEPKSSQDRPGTYSASTQSDYDLPRKPSYEAEPVLSFATSSQDAFSRFASQYTDNVRQNLEEFVGKNLISLIGIVILIIGVAVGAKYAIDNNLISPLTRIIIGYVFGFGLVGLAIKLKSTYHNFSAVLISGGMAIMYFVTYFAYSAYGLIGQLPTFGLMVMFTALTVAAALVYSRQVIAHIGLVGAYAVPFLLSSDSGNYLALFGYMTVVNAGILAISLKKLWKPLFYTASITTWLIFGGWLATKYRGTEHFELALTFVGTFFAIFYASRLAQKRIFADENELENLGSTLATVAILFFYCAVIGLPALSTLQWTGLLTFLAVAAVVVLATSFKHYGRGFIYLVVPAVWLIYGNWFTTHYNPNAHLLIASVFAALYFAIFYFSVLFYRLTKAEFTVIEHTSLILANAFTFYGFGYSIMDGQPVLRDFLGAFTAANAAFHFLVIAVVNRLKSDAVDVAHVLTILVLTFASIAVPVQFDGNVVTLVWVAEASVLFWYGRTRGVRLFEYASYPLMLIAFVSMCVDWATSLVDRSPQNALIPIANSDFITAIVFVISFAFILITFRDKRYEAPIEESLVKPIGYAIAGIGGFVLYNTFRTEISNYFYRLYVQTRPDDFHFISVRGDLAQFDLLAQLNYTLLFITVIALVNLSKFRSTLLAFISSALGIAALSAVATVGMYILSSLRWSFVAGEFDQSGISPWLYVAVRPLTYIFAGGVLYSLYRMSRDTLLQDKIDERSLILLFEAIAYTFAFIAASCELVNLMEQLGIPDSTKLGLSILWGIYALMMVVIGIAKNKKHLRIAAMTLLAVTLAKLFFYDISDLDTIPKTILFVTLGITLLLISFLYNKYKSVIFRTEASQED